MNHQQTHERQTAHLQAASLRTVWARAQIRTTLQGSIRSPSNSRWDLTQGWSSSPAAGLTCVMHLQTHVLAKEFRDGWVFNSCRTRWRGREHRARGFGGNMMGIERRGSTQDRPQDAGILVGQRDNGLLPADTGLELCDPHGDSVGAFVGGEHVRFRNPIVAPSSDVAFGSNRRASGWNGEVSFIR